MKENIAGRKRNFSSSNHMSFRGRGLRGIETGKESGGI
jgi:hypothetical protein